MRKRKEGRAPQFPGPAIAHALGGKEPLFRIANKVPSADALTDGFGARRRERCHEVVRRDGTIRFRCDPADDVPTGPNSILAKLRDVALAHTDQVGEIRSLDTVLCEIVGQFHTRFISVGLKFSQDENVSLTKWTR